MNKDNITEVLNFLNGCAHVLEEKVKSADITSAAVMLGRLKALLDEYQAAANQYLPDIDFRGFPKRDVFRQIGWVAKNVPAILKLVNADDYFKEARASADAFAETYGIDYKVKK